MPSSQEFDVTLDLSRTATVHVLHKGYVREGRRVGATCSLIVDEDVRIVVDPGLAANHEAILGPLRDHGLGPEDITDVTLSHHHPDHAINAALFPAAAVHDHWAVYRGDHWESRPAEGVRLGTSVMLLETPGHTPQDITVVAATVDGLVAMTHCWWFQAGPVEDPYADQDVLDRSRERILSLDGLVRIVPGHGTPFHPTDATTRTPDG